MKKTITTVEITDADVKVIQTQLQQGQRIMTYCAVQSIISDQEEETAELLCQMIAALPDAPGEFVFLIPRRAVILRLMALPSEDPEEIRDMIGLRLINQLPYPVEDVFYQHQVLGKTDEGLTRLIVTVIQKKISQHYCRLFQQAGIRDGMLVLSSQGLTEWLAYQERRSNAEASEPLMIINIDRKHSEICFYHNRTMFFSRSLPFGKEHILSDQAGDMVKQIAMSLQTYQRGHWGPDATKMTVLSTENEGKILKEFLQTRFDYPVKVLASAYGLPVADNIKRIVAASQQQCSLGPAVGAALTDVHALMNLAPVEVHEAKKTREQNRKLVRMACLLLMAAGLVVAGQFLGLARKSARLKALDRKIEEITPRLTAAKKKMEIVRKFDEVSQNRNFIPDLIDALSRLTPEEITFRSLTLDRKGYLVIQGYADTNGGVNDFRAQLIRSSRFQEVDLKFATQRTIAKKPLFDFSIASRLNHGGGY